MQRKKIPLQILVTVYDNRHLMGVLAYSFNNENCQIQVSAEAVPDMGIPDAPAGTYKFSKLTAVPDNLADQYGSHMILFEATDGPALEMANHDGKFVLSLHSGNVDIDDHLYQTEGGLRISNSDMEDLIEALQGSSDVTLKIEEKHAGLFAAIGHRKVSNMQLIPHPAEAGYSQAREEDNEGGGITSDPFFWMWAASEAENLMGSSSSDDTVGNNRSDEDIAAAIPGGGQTAGGGAGGSWGSDVISDSANAASTTEQSADKDVDDSNDQKEDEQPDEETDNEEEEAGGDEDASGNDE